MQAYIHFDDGIKWVRVIEGNTEWDEPIAGWVLQVMLCHGYNNLISPKGKVYREMI